LYQHILLSFDIWDEPEICPHCGSEDIELDLITECWVCCDCGAVSASYIEDLEYITRKINAYDRFDCLEIFERDHPGE